MNYGKKINHPFEILYLSVYLSHNLKDVISQNMKTFFPNYIRQFMGFNKDFMNGLIK